MIKIYKKCEKSIDNVRGIEEIDLDNYDKPFLLCIAAEGTDKSTFGVIKEGARAARVKTTDEFAAGYKIDEMPVDFLGLKFDNEKGISLSEFMYMFLKRGNDIKKQARKINFFTYCNATKIYVEVEKQLKEKLINDGYTEKEVIDILSQISLISIASQIDISKVNASSIIFKDVNDIEVYDSISKIASRKMNQLNRETYIGNLSGNNAPSIFTYNGTGEHELKEYFKEESIIKCPICAVVKTVLNNSYLNANSDELIPISSQLLLRVARAYNGEFESNDILFERLDSEITFDNTPKYSKEEIKSK